MKQLPTAEEWLKSIYNINSSSEVALGGKLLTDKLVEFAKLCVEQALKEASENAKAYTSSNGEWVSTNVTSYVNKESILNAYPLTNIK